MSDEVFMKLPQPAKELWESTYKQASSKYKDPRAKKIAWTHVKKQFKQSEGLWVGKAGAFPVKHKVVLYEFVRGDKQVNKSLDDGFIYYDYILSSTKEDEHGDTFYDFALKKAAEQINEYGVTGYIAQEGEHDLKNKFIAKGLSPSEIEEEIQKMDTGIKAISATFEDGKLKATLKIRKDLEEQVNTLQGASIEAVTNQGKEYSRAWLTGFTLTNAPANTDAVRI